MCFGDPHLVQKMGAPQTPSSSSGGVHLATAGPLRLLALGVEPGSGSVSAAVSSVPATVVCRHIIINSTGKALVFYVHTSSLSQLQTSGSVSFSEMLVKALIH